MNAKFYIESCKDTKRFILEINNHRVILANPVCQLFDDDRPYTNVNNILYFYYDFIIEKNKNYDGFDDSNVLKPKWKKHSSVYVYEDGATKYLSKIIDEALNYDLKTNSLRHYFFDGGGKKSETNYECCEVFKLTGSCEEDYFTINKYYRYFDYSADTRGPKECEFYNMFFGCGNSQLGRNVSGFYAYLNREDMFVVKKWVDEFMAYTEELIKREQNKSQAP